MTEKTEIDARILYRQMVLQGLPEPSPQQVAEDLVRFMAWLDANETETSTDEAIRPVAPAGTSSPAVHHMDRPLNEVNFLTVAEVASVMRVSKMTVYRLVHSSELPAVRVGRSFRVPEQAVYDYISESMRTAI